MDIQKPKIEFYKTRTISEILGDIFAFLRQDWRVHLKYFCYLALPASIVMGFSYNHILGMFTSPFFDTGLTGLSTIIHFVLWIVVATVSCMLLTAVFYALVRLYRQRDNGLENLEASQFVPSFKSCLRRVGWLAANFFVLMLVIAVLLSIVLGVLIALGSAVHLPDWVMAVCVILGYLVILGLMLPLQLIIPIYMMEDISFWNAVLKSYRYGMRLWGPLFVVTFVIMLVLNVLCSVITMPFYILTFVKAMLLSRGNFAGSLFFSFFGYASSVLLCLGLMISAYVDSVAAMVFYGHASDKIDGKGVADKIDHFDDFDAF